MESQILEELQTLNQSAVSILTVIDTLYPVVCLTAVTLFGFFCFYVVMKWVKR